MRPAFRRMLFAAGAAVALATAGHLRAVGGFVPCDIQATPRSGCTALTAADLASSLPGDGVTIDASSVTYAGSAIAAGRFTGGAGIIGFDAGVVLSSGNIAAIVGPNTGGSAASTNLHLAGDTDLTALSGFTTFDATILEFDFVPDKNRVFFQYVFSSEEYNEFVNRLIGGKLFNDVFAFYIGPKGDTLNRVNCAVVNGQPVSIQTINGGGPTLGTGTISHSELYINNDFHPTAPLDTQMDGLTKILTCAAPVLANQPNHIKLAIADASDGNLDSNVFIRAGSFTTTPPLRIVKKTDGTNNDAPPAPLVKAGETVAWTYEVTNFSPDLLTEVTVSDDQQASVTCPATTLGAGASMTCSASGTAILGDYVNVGMVEGRSPIIGSIEDSNPDRYFGAQPSIAIATRTNYTDNNAAPGPSILVGAPVMWTYEVTNTGNVELQGVIVSDSSGVPVDCSQIPGGPQKTTLLPGAMMVCSATGVATAGQYANTGTATGSIQVLTSPSGTKSVTVSSTDPDHYFGADPKLAIVKKTNGTDNDVAPGPLVLVGDPVAWSYTVTNTGNVPVADIKVTDDAAGAICTIGSLDAGQTATACTKTDTAKRGQYENTGTATGTYGPVSTPTGSVDSVPVSASNLDHYFGADPAVTLLKKTNGTNNDQAPGPYVLAGDPVTWTYTVTNSGNVTLTNLAVTDDKEGAVCTIASLAPGQSAPDCSKSDTAVKGAYANLGTVNGSVTTVLVDGQPKAVTVAGSDGDHYFGADPRVGIIKKTNGTDNDAAPGRFVLVGDPVVWSYSVTNTGNVPLTDLTVTDDKEGSICTIASLAVGATAADCTKSSTAKRDQYTNTATVSGRFDLSVPGGQTRSIVVSGANVDNYFGADPRIAIVKTTNGIDADAAPGPQILAGDPVVWTYVVTNTGNVPIASIAVTDDKEGAICTIALLPVGSTAVTCTKLGTAGKGQNENIGSAQGSFELSTPDGSKVVPVSASNPDHYFGVDPALVIVKKTNGAHSTGAPGRSLLVGDPVRWSYSVTNAGNVPLAGVTVTDDKEGAICTIASLAIGETAPDCTRDAVAVRGQYVNTGTAATTVMTVDTDGQSKTNTVSGASTDYYFGADPRLSLVKTTNGSNNDQPPGRYILVGDPVVWTFAVTNTGNVPLANIAVTDDKLGTVCTIASLAAGQTSAACSQTGVAQVGSYGNTGTANSTFDIATVDGQPRTVPITATDVEYYFGADPKISLIKRTNGTDNDAAPGPTALVGSLVVWSYSVTNAGNVPLAAISVTDDREGGVCALPTLAVGQTVECTKSAVAKPGPYVNVGTASGSLDIVRQTGPTTVTVSSSNVDHYFGADPRIAIVKKTVTYECVPAPDKGNGDGHDWSGGDDDHDWGGKDRDGDGGDKGRQGWDQKSGTKEFGKDSTGKDYAWKGDKQYGSDRYEDRDDKDHADKNHGGKPGDPSGMTCGWVVKYDDGKDGQWAGDGHDDRGEDKDHKSDKGYGSEKGHGSDKGYDAGKSFDWGRQFASDWGKDSQSSGNWFSFASDSAYGAFSGGSSYGNSSGWNTSDKDKTGWDKSGDDKSGWDKSGGDKSGWDGHDGSGGHGGGGNGRMVLVRRETDNNVAPGPIVKVGASIGWTYTVSNIGNVPLSNIVVTDDKQGVICTIATLGVGQTAATCTKSGTALPGQYENLGTASTAFGPVFVNGSPVPNVPVTASDPDHYFGGVAGVSIVKSTNGVDNDAAPGLVVTAGSHVTWTYTITNTGNLPIAGIRLVDDKVGTIACPATQLPSGPNGVMICMAGGFATAGQYVNTGTVTGTTTLGPVSASDVDYYWGLDKHTYKGPNCR